MYKINGIGFVHYNSKKIVLEKDTLILHDFSFSRGFDNGAWNEDYCYHFIYEPSIGVFARHFSSIDKPFGGFNFLLNNSCLTTSQILKLQRIKAYLKK